MRMYLSSYRMGNHIDALHRLVKKGSRVAVIENALDHLPAEKRKNYCQNIYDIQRVFTELGYKPFDLDLRHFFGHMQKLEQTLNNVDMVWVCGGNAFLLRRAMKQSGFDKIVPKLLKKNRLAYGGWSAGICVLGNTLKGIDLCDPPSDNAAGYDPDVIWDGLGIIDYSIAPHYRSQHHEADMIEKVVEYFIDNHMPHKTLRDGDVILYNGDKGKLLLFEQGHQSEVNLSIKDRRN